MNSRTNLSMKSGEVERMDDQTENNRDHLDNDVIKEDWEHSEEVEMLSDQPAVAGVEDPGPVDDLQNSQNEPFEEFVSLISKFL